MRAALIAPALAFAYAAPALAEPVTVWISDTAPEARTVERADLQTGGTLHLWSVDLAFPPMPETPKDGEHIEQVLAAVENGKARWDEFEIELAIAKDMKMVVGDVSLLRSDRDRTDLAGALIFQGTAEARAFDPNTFASDERAKDFRYDGPSASVPRAWLDAYALMGKLADRSMFADGTAWQHYQRVSGTIEGLPKATLTVEDVGGDVWVDGRKAPVGSIPLTPGKHYLHVVRGGIVHGRAILDAAPGGAYATPRAVDAESLAVTREKVLTGKVTGLPESVVASLALLAADHEGGPLFLGADDGRRFYVVSYDGKAALKDTRLVTGVLYAEIGGGILATPIFEQATDPTALYAAGAASAGLGFEVGISYFAFGGGIDGTFTPGNTIQFASGEANSSVAVFPQPHFEIGAYAVRPTKPTPTFVILGGIAWLAPAHLGYGGRMAVGIPMKNETTWVRVSLGGYYGPSTLWDPAAGQAAVSAFARVGFGVKP